MADLRIGESGQARRPLRGMCCVAPAGAVRLDVAFGALPKGNGARGIQSGAVAGLLAEELTIFARQRSRLGQRKGV
jgi:hypothetical protein